MADNIPPALMKLALEHCEPTPFEKYAQTVFAGVIGHRFKPLGGYKDGGADGFVDSDISEDVGRATVFFQASKEIDTEGKVKRTVKRLKEFGRTPKTLIYATSRAVSHIDKIQLDLSDELEANIRIYDSSFFEAHLNHNEDIKTAFNQHLKPAIAFLEQWIAPSYPSSNALKDAQVISAFLGQEIERKLGTAKTLEGVCDSLIFWALEGTNPAKEILMSEEEIIEKVEGVIPSAKQFFRGQVGDRLKKLSRKINGSRAINVFSSKGGYCLPFESRKELERHTLEDEALKSSVTAGFHMRILEAAGRDLGTNLIETIAGVLHKTLEAVFERQGFEAARLFLDDSNTADIGLESRTIIEIANEKLIEAGLNHKKGEDTVEVVKKVLRGVFYHGTNDERAYCSRLARTYILLFIIRNTPEVIEYFNTMSKQFHLYVGSDLVIRAISEYYLHPNDQMTVNAFRILKQAGSKIILSEAMLEEVHSHIYASHREYENVYYDIDSIVDIDLASQSDRILIRAYYYAKLELENPHRPRNWSQFLNNFVTASKMSGSVSPVSMRSLRDTLCQRFGFEYQDKSAQPKGVNEGEVRRLAKKIFEMRGGGRKEVLSENDATMILCVDALRRQSEGQIGNPYGFKAWYLTQDSISGAATIACFPGRRGNKYVMRPEFLINYIAYNPTNAQVRESLKSIFPSALGIRLGSRLDGRTLDRVLSSIREANSVDPARAAAIVAEHADALKSDRIREFAIKYAPPARNARLQRQPLENSR